MRFLISFCFLICQISVLFAQEVEIPEKIDFAGMELELSASVRKTLKTEVENLKRNEKYFRMKIERADIYFPVIEKVFDEEGFPKEFKFLALQESSLVPDAVSSSNAVGYWQFKKESAQEVGLRIDNTVDERMNIVAASRGASKYLKRNNVTLNNWIYALLSYNMGLGGVKSEVDKDYIGATHMKIKDNMHWYVIRFLAHKIAFENEVGKSVPALTLHSYTNGSNKSLSDIASETSLELEELKQYNKWLLDSKVPDDRLYAVVLPVRDNDATAKEVLKGNKEEKTTSTPTVAKEDKPRLRIFRSERKKNGETETTISVKNGPEITLITSHNKLRAIRAKEGETFQGMALAAGIRIEDFLIYNEVKKYEKPIPGRYYYVVAKRNKALIEDHIVKNGETLWDISQQYGIRVSAIRKKNHMKMKEEPKPGRVLLLRKKLGKGEEPKYINETEKPKNTESSRNHAVLTKDKPATDKLSVQVHTADYQVEASQKKIDSSLYQYHAVQPGETLYGLSKKYLVQVDTLKSWNEIGPEGLKASSLLIVGKIAKEEVKVVNQEIKSEEYFIFHTVQPGETLYKIAKQYGKSVNDIMEWNSKADFNVSVGEKIKILSN